LAETAMKNTGYQIISRNDSKESAKFMGKEGQFLIKICAVGAVKIGKNTG